MRYFFDEQGRTRVFARGVHLYVESGNPRRTPLVGKIAIYGWTLTISENNPDNKSGFEIAVWKVEQIDKLQ